MSEWYDLRYAVIDCLKEKTTETVQRVLEAAEKLTAISPTF